MSPDLREHPNYGYIDVVRASDYAALAAALEHIRDNGHWLGLYSIHKIAVEALTGKPFYSEESK